MTAIDKVIQIAENEVGYLEKKSNSNLYDKTVNAGNKNYTKYWSEIKPDYQGQPWCACFLTWCFVQAFGKEKAEKLLKHYPYVYCPTMSGLFNLNTNPKRGDIVLFYRNGRFSHTGIVISVEGDFFRTIEGNTSDGSGIIPNGGSVCRKGYYNSKLPGTKFCTPDYSLVESGDLTMTQYEELKSEITTLKKENEHLKSVIGRINDKMIYNYLDTNIPDWAFSTVKKMADKGFLKGNEKGELGLTDELLRIFVINDRAGVYGE